MSVFTIFKFIVKFYIAIFIFGFCIAFVAFCVWFIFCLV